MEVEGEADVAGDALGGDADVSDAVEIALVGGTLHDFVLSRDDDVSVEGDELGRDVACNRGRDGNGLIGWSWTGGGVAGEVLRAREGDGQPNLLNVVDVDDPVYEAGVDLVAVDAGSVGVG